MGGGVSGCHAPRPRLDAAVSGCVLGVRGGGEEEASVIMISRRVHHDFERVHVDTRTRHGG